MMIRKMGAHASWDLNRDGQVDRDEYMRAAARQIRQSDRWQSDPYEALSFHGRLFARADLDGDGVLIGAEREYEELLHSASSFFGHDDELGDGEMRAALDEADENRDGTVDKSEWLKAMHATAAERWHWEGFLDQPDIAAYFEALFAHADVNADGAMDAREAQLSTLLGWRDHGDQIFADRVLVNTVLDVFDTDRDGRLDREEIADGVARVSDQVIPEKTETFAGHIQRRFAEEDANADSVLDREELLELVREMPLKAT